MTNDYMDSMVNYLLNRRDFVSGQELAQVLNVSTKTIARAVKQANESAGDVTIIESQRGRGYRLNFQNYFSQRDNMRRPEGMGGITSAERRDEIIKRLLITSPQQYRMDDIWGKFYLSDSAVASDMRALRVMLDKFRLTLNRVGDRVWIDGTETDVRRAIAQLVKTDDVATDRFLQPNQTIKQRDASFVTMQLDLVERMMHADIPYPYSVNLFTHLYILIERFRNSVALSDGEFTDAMRSQMEEHPSIREVCEKVVENLSTYLGTTLPAVEVYFLYQYLTSSRIHHHNADSHEITDQVRVVTEFLIDKVIEDPEYRHINRQSLLISLAKHMKPLMNRLENNIKVNNALLEQIKLEYSHLFNAVTKATVQLSEHFHLATIDDEEIGFITVYFAQAVETSASPLNVLLVCTTGLGTAQLLRSKIEKRLPSFHVVETLAARNLDSEIARYPHVDMVISTIRLPETVTKPTVVVSAMLTIEDQERLEEEADRVRQGAML